MENIYIIYIYIGVLLPGVWMALANTHLVWAIYAFSTVFFVILRRVVSSLLLLVLARYTSTSFCWEVCAVHPSPSSWTAEPPRLRRCHQRDVYDSTCLFPAVIVNKLLLWGHMLTGGRC